MSGATGKIQGWWLAMIKVADGEDTQVPAVEPIKILSRKRKINGAFFVSGLGVPSVSQLTQSRCHCGNFSASD